MNIFVKKTMASALNLPMEHVDAILNAAGAFKSNEINRELAINVFDKVAKKSPSEINDLLKKLNLML